MRNNQIKQSNTHTAKIIFHHKESHHQMSLLKISIDKNTLCSTMNDPVIRKRQLGGSWKKKEKEKEQDKL